MVFYPRLPPVITKPTATVLNFLYCHDSVAACRHRVEIHLQLTDNLLTVLQLNQHHGRWGFKDAFLSRTDGEQLVAGFALVAID
jgi:serine/threonine protein kinase HipA of HipAB toxin-antitoxin module